MCKDNKQTKCKQLEFNTYCIFTEEKQDVKETIGLIFKDYLENIKKKTKWLFILLQNYFEHVTIYFIDDYG